MAEIKKSLFISKHGRRNPFLSDRREGLQEHSRQRGGRDQSWQSGWSAQAEVESASQALRRKHSVFPPVVNSKNMK